MAQTVAPGSQDAPSQTQMQLYAHPHAHTPPHGRKRPADSSLESEQRLSKRFDLLNLVDRNGTRLYFPVSDSTSPSLAPITTPSASSSSSSLQQDDMSIEDTPHRIYISDLSAELDSIPSDSHHPIFLPDIEKHLSKIPLHILAGPTPAPTEHNQVVLYNVPTSLTVPEERDSVRKAIVEARQRIRERQGVGGGSGGGSGYGEAAAARKQRDMEVVDVIPQEKEQAKEDDWDAMDID